MILVLGHVARVHPTANSSFVPFAGTNPGSAPNFPVARHPVIRAKLTHKLGLYSLFRGGAQCNWGRPI